MFFYIFFFTEELSSFLYGLNTKSITSFLSNNCVFLLDFFIILKHHTISDTLVYLVKVAEKK